jgi:hypothetical protein
MSKSSPPAPDYTGAAIAQGQQSQDLATQQTFANRPTINTPWGTQTWKTAAGTDPSTGKPVTNWTSDVELSPQQKSALDSQMEIQAGQSTAAKQLLGQATSATANPMAWGSLPARSGQLSAPSMGDQPLPDGSLPNSSFSQGNLPISTMNPMSFGSVQKSVTGAGDVRTSLDGTPADFRQQAQDAVWNLQKPMLAERRDSTETQLANMGLARGTEAWNRESRNLDDAEARARLASVEAGRVEASQLFGQNLQSGQFENNAQSQKFGQGVVNANLNNSGQAQEFQQGAQSTQINNAAAGQTAQQNQSQAAFENTSSQAQFQQLMQRAQAGDSRALQELQAQIQAGSFNNANRTGAMTEMITQRGQPLNELNALLRGNQVSMPSFPGAPNSNAGSGQAADLTGAMNSSYGAALDASNAKNAGTNSAMSSAASLAMMYMMFSDERLKEEITTIGVLSTGVRVVYYRYRGLLGRWIGVIAQELALVQPEAVSLHPSGYLMVDYSKVKA